MQGAGEVGAHSCLLCGLLGNAQLITCAQLTCHIHTGHYMCRPHHAACSLHVQTSSHMHTPHLLYTHSCLCARISVSHAVGALHVQRLRHMQRSHAKPGLWGRASRSLAGSSHWQTLTSSVLLPLGGPPGPMCLLLALWRAPDTDPALPVVIVGRHRSHL